MHGEECVGVDEFYHLHDDVAVALAHYADDDFALRLGVPALAIEYCHAVAALVDGIGKALVVAREDGELHGLVATAYAVVERHAADEEHDETEDDTCPVVEDEVAGGDDDHVASHDDCAERHGLVLVDDGSDDVGAAGGTMVLKAECESYAADDGAEHACHE